MFFKLVILILASLAAAEDLSFTYNGFRSDNLSLDGKAGVTSNGLLSLTNNSPLRTGHGFYPHPVTFKNSSNGTVFSFSTTFVFAIRSEYSGMAFVVAPTRGLPEGLPSQYLGLFNYTNNGNATNHVFAVELDISQDLEFNDSSGNHVGIDVNGLNSEKSAPAGYYPPPNQGRFKNLDINSGQAMQVWVDYDGTEKQINVTLAPISEGKPNIPLLSYMRDLSPILNKTMYVGFSSSTGLDLSPITNPKDPQMVSSHYVLGWSFKMNGKAQELVLSQLPKLFVRDVKGRPLFLIVSVPVIFVFVALLVVAGVTYNIRKRGKFAEILEDWELEYGPQRFKYEDLYIATKGFREKELLGKGGFGKVYKGILPTSKIEIAVKMISHESRQGMKEFVAEIISNGRLRHRNLVPLLGYCRRKRELLLVYEYMANGSLDKYLYGQPAITLDWSQRFRAIKGVASGLLYLHEEWDQVVVHRDVKPSNVLLDGEWNGRLGDFGLARLYDHGADPQTTHIAGTLGYLAPEHTRSGRATTSTDVFAFGVFLLEVACGRRPIEAQGSDVSILVDWVFSCWNRGNILEATDRKLGTEFIAEEVGLVLKLGLLCSHKEPTDRPRMRQVVQYLEGAELSSLGASSTGLAFSHSEGFVDFANGMGFAQSLYVPEPTLLSGGR